MAWKEKGISIKRMRMRLKLIAEWKSMLDQEKMLEVKTDTDLERNDQEDEKKILKHKQTDI